MWLVTFWSKGFQKFALEESECQVLWSKRARAPLQSFPALPQTGGPRQAMPHLSHDTPLELYMELRVSYIAVSHMFGCPLPSAECEGSKDFSYAGESTQRSCLPENLLKGWGFKVKGQEGKGFLLTFWSSLSFIYIYRQEGKCVFPEHALWLGWGLFEEGFRVFDLVIIIIKWWWWYDHSHCSLIDFFSVSTMLIKLETEWLWKTQRMSQDHP